MLSDSDRDLFDDLLEGELEVLPEHIQEQLDEVPVVVEDRPSAQLVREMGLDRRGVDLCGLHSGIPLTDRSVEHSGVIPDRIMLFREPIMRAAGWRRGRSGDVENLREQVRITLLHEIGHHFGLDEEDLEELGYG